MLRALYARIETGEQSGTAEVDAEIRFATHERPGLPAGDFGVPSVRTAAVAHHPRALAGAGAPISI